MSALLLCRESEANRLARLLSGAREGRSGVLVLRGEPGIGNSALLDDAVRSADERVLLRLLGIAAATVNARSRTPRTRVWLPELRLRGSIFRDGLGAVR